MEGHPVIARGSGFPICTPMRRQSTTHLSDRTLLSPTGANGRHDGVGASTLPRSAALRGSGIDQPPLRNRGAEELELLLGRRPCR